MRGQVIKQINNLRITRSQDKVYRVYNPYGEAVAKFTRLEEAKRYCRSNTEFLAHRGLIAENGTKTSVIERKCVPDKQAKHKDNSKERLIKLINWLKENCSNQVEFAMMFEIADIDVPRLYRIYEGDTEAEERLIKDIEAEGGTEDYYRMIGTMTNAYFSSGANKKNN